MNLVELLFDAGLAILLIVTISYCSRLSRRIRLLQDGRSELASMITQFDQATGRAVASMAELQSVSKRITEALHIKIEKANFLADDLAFLIEKSTKLASQIEQANAARATEMAAAAAKPKPQAESVSFYKAPASPAKPKLVTYPSPAAQSSETPPSAPSAASLELLLNRLASQGGAASTAAKQAQIRTQPLQSPRTDAERELLEALKGR